jgi:ribose transport system substrate-binding protein
VRKSIVILFITFVVMMMSACSSEQTGADKKIKIGVSISLEANNTVKTWFEGIKARGESYGFEVVGIDANGDPGKQASDIDSLLAQNVDAVVVWPLDADALRPAINRVKEKDIPIMGIDFNVKKGGTDYGLTNEVILGREETAVQVAKLMAETFTEKTEVAGIGYAVPVPGNMFVMEKFKSEVNTYNHLKWVGQQNNQTDNISGAEPLMNNMLTKNPNIKAVFAYNDESAIGAAQAALNSNKTLYSKENPDGIMIIGFNADESGIKAIKEGKEYATYNLNPVKAGAISVDYIHQLLVDKKDSSEIPKEVLTSSPMITLENVSEFIPWKDEIEAIQNGEEFSPLAEDGETNES